MNLWTSSIVEFSVSTYSKLCTVSRGWGMVMQVISTDDTPGFPAGPDECEYQVAQPRWRVRASAATLAAADTDWSDVILILRAQRERQLPR